MNYGLAKKLKDAGFKQPGVASDYPGLFSCGCDDLWAKKGKLPDTKEVLECGRERAYKPTLSELIEACGQDFEELVFTDAYSEKAGMKTKWRAYMSEEAFAKTGIDCVVECDGYEIGDTPEEAVANLWLKLNETQ